MKRYAVVFEESAQADVRDSYEWGCRVWGKREAQQWVRQLRTAVSLQLAIVPKGFALAPEDDEFLEEIRQMVVGRYRVLFTRELIVQKGTESERSNGLSSQERVHSLREWAASHTHKSAALRENAIRRENIYEERG